MSNTITTDSLYLSEYQRQQMNKANDMDKDAFLKILIAQLQNQDPMSPMEDREFIAQMAQFTSLEQMTNMNLQLTKFLETQQQNQFISNAQLIGKVVEWDQLKEDANGNVINERLSGIVTAVKFKDGAAQLVTNNGHTISTSVVNTVKENN